MGTYSTGSSMGTIGVRLVLTLAGAAGLIIGSFLDWLKVSGPTHGTDVGAAIFWSTNPNNNPSFFASAGFVTIVIGLIALLGLAMRTGGLTRLAGALGIVAFVTYVITLYRVKEADFGIDDVDLGMWLILVGSVIALIGGFLGTRQTAVTTAAAPPAAPPPPPA